jgi:hypothetical protein
MRSAGQRSNFVTILDHWHPWAEEGIVSPGNPASSEYPDLKGGMDVVIERIAEPIGPRRHSRYALDEGNQSAIDASRAMRNACKNTSHCR